MTSVRFKKTLERCILLLSFLAAHAHDLQCTCTYATIPYGALGGGRPQYIVIKMKQLDVVVSPPAFVWDPNLTLTHMTFDLDPCDL